MTDVEEELEFARRLFDQEDLEYVNMRDDADWRGLYNAVCYLIENND